MIKVMKTLILLFTLTLLTMTAKSQYYLDTGVYYSKTLKEWINIDDIQAITDTSVAPKIETGFHLGPLPEWWDYAGRHYFHIKYKRGRDYIIHLPDKKEVIRLHDDFVSIWKKYKAHYIKLQTTKQL